MQKKSIFGLIMPGFPTMGGQGGRPPLLGQNRTFSLGGPPSGPPSGWGLRPPIALAAKISLRPPLPNFSGPPSKSGGPPSEMNLFLYDFLEFTQILHRNFFFSKIFFKKDFRWNLATFFFLFFRNQFSS